MSVKGSQKKEITNKMYVGFAPVEIRAFNPTRTELNTLLGKEPGENENEFKYVDVDQEGNEKVKMTFWLYNAQLDKYFIYSFGLIKKEVISKDKAKIQLINNTLDTTYAPFEVDEDEKITDEIDGTGIPEWFANYTDDDKNPIGEKTYRRAIVGEEKLGTLLKRWLGRFNFKDVQGGIEIDVDSLFDGDFSEIQSLITVGDEEANKTGYDSPFVVLLGVSTDEDDATQKYQQVYSKGFLPSGFMKYINKKSFPNLDAFSSDYAKNVWKKFEKEVEGQYGFQAFYKLAPISEYDPTEDIADSDETKSKAKDKEASAPQSSKY